MGRFLSVLLFIGLVVGSKSTPLKAQYAFSKKPLLEVLEELNHKTGYTLLYRESMVQGKTISLNGLPENIFEILKVELKQNGLDLIVDETLRQVVIFRTKESDLGKEISFQGFIIDASTGERLPYATVSWVINGEVTGVAANEAGYFNIQIQDEKEQIELKSSYIGYETLILRLTSKELKTMDQLSIRLNPVVTNSKEVIVTGFRQFSDNALVQKTIDIAQGNILGEDNTIKALQQLPSVTLGPALSEGLNVRGSPADGFKVLLDGVTIYNQTHLFGLFDNFNSDALQTSGIYYGIIPASYQGNVGGILDLITRTGSVNSYHADIGVSNTSLNATVEGPLLEGKASFLLSGRTSLIEQLNWTGNDEIINWGLDVDRSTKYLISDNVTLRTDLVRPIVSTASFGDVHAKLNLETNSGSRFILSGYYGTDDISVDAERLFRSFNTGQDDQVEYKPVNSENRWKNGKFSGHMQSRLNQRLFSNVTIGWSVFNTHFSKDDFTYTQINSGTGALESFTSDITIKSVFNELVFKEKMEWIQAKTKMAGGFSYHYYFGEYFEDSFERPSYFKDDKASRLDMWFNSEFIPLSFLKVKAGIRTHYYSQGDYLNISPRVDAQILNGRLLSFGGGYSRNYQYMNRISFSNVLSSDVWVLVDERQAPAYVDNFTTGIYLEQKHFLAQLEAYWKNYENLRLHEIDTYSVTNVFSASPWFSDNSGTGRGIELLVINEYDRFELNQSLTLSRMELQNQDINGGDPFPADWDRTWQYTGSIKINFPHGIESSVTQIFGTGTPNKLSTFGEQERKRLDDYVRTDLRISYTGEIKKSDLEVSVNLYNVFNISNPWYRDFGFGLEESSGSQRFVSVPAEVYDLGFQPSFSLSFKF